MPDQVKIDITENTTNENGNSLKLKQIVSNQPKFSNSSVITNELAQHIDDLYTSNGLNKSRLNSIVERAIHWCLVNGFVAVPKDRTPSDLMVCTYLPFTLCPTPIKREYFQQVFNLQPDINQLVYKISNSPSFMESAFENVIGIDPFVSRLWKTYNDALKVGYNQKINLTIIRSDYMLHTIKNNNTESLAMKQVEVNTIAAGFGYIGTKMSLLHKELVKWLGYSHMLDKLPYNEPIAIAKGFAEAWRLYNSKNAIVLFIVLDVEINIADQRHLEYEVYKYEPQIEIKRCTLTQLNELGHIDENKTLFYDGREVALVYYRAGYAPSHYKSEKEWDALFTIETSKAVKCPTIGTFLAGMKKIQEYISHEENLAELCNNDTTKIDAFKAVSAEFFKLDKEENVEKVLKNPENYVLKPQREGGGNNYYKSAITEMLLKIKDLENKSSTNGSQTNGNFSHQDKEMYNKDMYIVMELLRPVTSNNYIISPKSQQALSKVGSSDLLNKMQITNELGIYGVLVMDGEKTILNQTTGYCLRTKPAEENEGGVMCGTGALDSIYFID